MNTRLTQTSDPDLATLVGAFNNMVDALEERVERDARFAADVSHELRTPVTTLVTSLSVLEHSADLSDRSTQAVRLTATELDRFRRSLEDLITLGRLDSGIQETQLSRIGIGSLVRHTLESTGRPAELLIDRTSGDDPPVLVDRQQISRAVINLLDNADSHGGGVVAVAVGRHEDFVDVTVEDHGNGIAPEDRERIFERFARAGQRRSGTGTGLGLSIVAQTVELHDGSVWCSDNDGGGTRFTMRLPIAPTDDGDP
jgi:signal transduction histidine kinase